MPSIAILGPGAVGGFLAAAIARDGADVVLIGREPTVTIIGQKGIEVESSRFGTFHAMPRAERRLKEQADVLVIATKAPQLDDALERVEEEPLAVVPLLNGIDHVERLRNRFVCPVIAGTIRVQAYREGPNRIVQRVDLSRVILASPGHVGLEQALRRAGIDLGQHDGETSLLWGKLARLAAIALSTAAASADLGDVRDDAVAAATEIVPVAQALGADIELDFVLEQLRDLPDSASSSLRVDIDSGSPTNELEAISGPVLRGAAEHGLEIPVVKRLVATIEARLHRE